MTRRGMRTRILWLGCGPGRELRSLNELREPLEVVLVDEDRAALEAAHSEALRVRGIAGADRLVTTLQGASTELDAESLYARFGSFDFIYIPSLAEPDLLARLWPVVSPTGCLTAGSFNAGCSSRPHLDMWTSRRVVYRTPFELVGLGESLAGANCAIQMDPSQHQMFLTLARS